MEMKGRRIYVVDEKRIKKHKRDTYLLLGMGLIFIFLFDIVSSSTDSNIHSLFFYYDKNNFKLFFAGWFMIISISMIILWGGVRVQPFAMYEGGIVPPLKPWSKMFSKGYFVPYERIKEIDVDRWKIIEYNGRKSNLKSWFLFNFVRSGKEADKVAKMLEVIADKINRGEKVKEIKEEELKSDKDVVYIEGENLYYYGAKMKREDIKYAEAVNIRGEKGVVIFYKERGKIKERDVNEIDVKDLKELANDIRRLIGLPEQRKYSRFKNGNEFHRWRSNIIKKIKEGE